MAITQANREGLGKRGVVHCDDEVQMALRRLAFERRTSIRKLATQVLSEYINSINPDLLDGRERTGPAALTAKEQS